MIKLLITDLDDTLYSWIEFFVPAFYGMLDELSKLLGKPRKFLQQEYKQVHQEKGSVEFPYATLLLPSVKAAYPGSTREELLEKLDPVFHKFNYIRKKNLKLYPGVEETLKNISEKGITIVGYTDSAEENGFYRLKKLKIDDFFKNVYVSYSQYDRPEHLPSSPKIKIVSEKKPNPEILKKICKTECVAVEEAVYLGDSLTKDIFMASRAGITSVLCKYPCDKKEQKELYLKLVAISNWTKEDFKNEAAVKELCKKENIHPDYEIKEFKEIFMILEQLNKSAQTFV